MGKYHGQWDPDFFIIQTNCKLHPLIKMGDRIASNYFIAIEDTFKRYISAENSLLQDPFCFNEALSANS